MAEAERDPLAELLIDAGAIDKQRIAAVLKGVVAIDSGTGRAAVQAGFRSLSVRQKALAYLLARKVAVLLGVAEEESASPSDLASDTGMPSGSVRPTLSALAQEHMISKIGHTYELSAAQVNAAIDALVLKDEGRDNGESPPPRAQAKKRARSGTTARPAAKKAAKRASTSVQGGAARRKTKKSAKPVAGVKSTKSAKATRSSKAAKASGPMVLVESLIEQGYFDQPRTLKEVQVRLKNKSGYTIKVTTLSPVMTRLLRRDILDREQVEGGKYAYRRAGRT